ncbi:MAG: sigma-70 family RNA polymerase sigma factor [Gloeobacteraceae cyanobacterium ES-bin-316]|nr:sigma-70 family RNA polymerase sigma factor [Ferruginibacter sp.]
MKLSVATISEADLIYQLRLKNERAYNYLYDAYSQALFGSIKRMVRCRLASEEILQNVFLKVWLHIDMYSTEKSSLYTWMLSIARNEAIDYLRSKQAKNTGLTSSIIKTGIKMDALIERRLERLDLLKSLSLLPHKERVIIELFIIGFTCREIGQLLKLPEGTVKTKMRGSYRKLRAILS